MSDLIKCISQINHNEANMGTVEQLLSFISSGNEPEVRRIAKFKLSLALRFLRGHEKKQCLDMLVETLRESKDDSWLQRNILEGIYHHLEVSVLDDIYPFLNDLVKDRWATLRRPLGSLKSSAGFRSPAAD